MDITLRHAVPEDWSAVHEIFQQDHVLAGMKSRLKRRLVG